MNATATDNLVALTRAVTHAAANLSAAKEAEIDAREQLKRAESFRNRCNVELINARAALDKALDS